METACSTAVSNSHFLKIFFRIAEGCVNESNQGNSNKSCDNTSCRGCYHSRGNSLDDSISLANVIFIIIKSSLVYFSVRVSKLTRFML